MDLNFINDYLKDAVQIIKELNTKKIEEMVNILDKIRKANGRLFILGVGGSAANASHAVNDFRKIAGIESYCPTDNVSELTARVNDDGWDTSFCNWLKGSKLNKNDCLFVLSVGGGNAEKNISNNLVLSLKYAKEVGSKVIGIVGRDGGYTAKVADEAVIVPTVSDGTVTPHVEGLQGVIWHLIVSHPKLKENQTTWERQKV